VKNLIEMLPFFEQTTMNAVSTLFLSTIREFLSDSLPKYLMEHSELLDQFIEFLDQPITVSNICHILFRACLRVPAFTKHVYGLGIIGSFTQLLVGSDFDRVATAYGTYDALLTTFPKKSAKFLQKGNNWQICQIQFKQLLASPNYLVQLNFLPILFRFLTPPESRELFFRYLEDLENLQVVMALLRDRSHRIRSGAYSLFKFFVQNPRRAECITSALKSNSPQLCKCLDDLPLDGNDPALEDEKRSVIAILQELS
jgi:calcium binding protein 39